MKAKVVLKKDSGELPAEQHLTCQRCAYDRALHHAANLTDGAFVGAYLLICPTAVFMARGFDVFGREEKRVEREKSA